MSKPPSMKASRWKAILNLQLVSIVVMVLIIGLGIYIVHRYVEGGESPAFELAMISAVIGGLLFAGGFTGVTSTYAKEVRRIGLSYLVATISFVFMGLYLPILKVPGMGEVLACAVISLSLLAALLSFGWATVRLIMLIPVLWK